MEEREVRRGISILISSLFIAKVDRCSPVSGGKQKWKSLDVDSLLCLSRLHE